MECVSNYGPVVRYVDSFRHYCRTSVGNPFMPIRASTSVSRVDDLGLFCRTIGASNTPETFVKTSKVGNICFLKCSLLYMDSRPMSSILSRFQYKKLDIIVSITNVSIVGRFGHHFAYIVITETRINWKHGHIFVLRTAKDSR